MEQVLDDLYRWTDPLRSREQRHSHLLRRPGGNLLITHFKGPSSVVDDLDAIEELGGVKAMLVTHAHEAGADHKVVAERFGCALHVHEADLAPTKKKATRCEKIAFAGGGFRDGDDVWSIHVPGHTAGTVFYLWRRADGVVAFTGDTLVPAEKPPARFIAIDDWALNVGRTYAPIAAACLAPVVDADPTVLFPARSDRGDPSPERTFEPGGFAAFVASIEAAVS